MKAVLLARGLGRRMRDSGEPAALTPAQQAAADAGVKSMMPVGDRNARPFLDHVLSALADAACLDVCLVVAPDHDAIRRYYEAAGRPSRVTLSYAVQAAAGGTAPAVLAARSFAGSDPFLVLNADNLYPAEVLRELVRLNEPGLPVFGRASLVDDSGFAPERVMGFAIVAVDRDGYLSRIVEKPDAERARQAGPHALISMNVWRFDARIFEACQAVPLSIRGEHELPEAVGLAMSRGVKFRALPARGPVFDLSRRTDVAGVSRRLAVREARP